MSLIQRDRLEVTPQLLAGVILASISCSALRVSHAPTVHAYRGFLAWTHGCNQDSSGWYAPLAAQPVL